MVQTPPTDDDEEPQGKILPIVDIRVQKGRKVGGKVVPVVCVDYGKFFLAVNDADFTRDGAYRGKNLSWDDSISEKERYGRPCLVTSYMHELLHCLDFVKKVCGRARGVFLRRHKGKRGT